MCRAVWISGHSVIDVLRYSQCTHWIDFGSVISAVSFSFFFYLCQFVFSKKVNSGNSIRNTFFRFLGIEFRSNSYLILDIRSVVEIYWNLLLASPSKWTYFFEFFSNNLLIKWNLQRAHHFLCLHLDVFQLYRNFQMHIIFLFGWILISWRIYSKFWTVDYYFIL